MHLNRKTKKKVNDDLPDYLTFPDHPVLQRFRHEWIMVPHSRPRVPVFANTKMPRAGMKDEEKARLCSLYWRPWTLCADFSQTPHVPHLLQMRLYPAPIVRHRLRAKSRAPADETEPSYADSWGRYIRGNVVSEHLVSHSLRSLCPVTAQPDWGSLSIRYSGREIDRGSLSQYLSGYRNHQGFHEQCVEQIFSDLMTLAPDSLQVAAFYQRRGGIDITPWRSSVPLAMTPQRLGRQ